MTPKVCILLCTYNGGKYLRSQIDSLFRQKDVDVAIMAHDDGSSDNTLDILNEYGIPLYGTEHLGAAHGFFYLMENAGDADYYAFCDQDDIWDEDKLISAINFLGGDPSVQKPMLYGSGTRLVTQDGQLITIHKADSQRSLTSRLFYSSISGNTIVFNRPMRDIAVMHHPEDMVMHDSWMIKLCIAMGGRLIIDEEPHMDYRMHSSNTVGMELNLKQKISKFRRVAGDRGEGQELIDICSLYGVMIKPAYRDLAEAVIRSRTDKSSRRNFMKKYDIDFRNRAFNIAFALKVRRGNL